MKRFNSTSARAAQHRRTLTVASLAAAVERFVVHLLDAAISPHVVLGPLVWCPAPGESAGKLWYFIAAVCGPAGFRCQRLSADDEDLAAEARALTMMVMVDRVPRVPRVLHDMDDELAMAKLCEGLWPSDRTRALRAAVEREREHAVPDRRPPE